MLGKVIDLLKNQSFIIPTLFLKNYRTLGINDTQFILLCYLMNMDSSFNPKQMAIDLNIDLEDIMKELSNLADNGLLKIDIVNKKVREEHVNLDDLYQKLAFLIVNEKETKEQSNLFDIFEKEFGRTLSPIEYETIAAWQNDYNDELVLLALKEAVFNGVSNLRYIDKILHEWYKKGIKTEQDVLNERKKYQSNKSTKKLMDYDWLNERDN